MDDEIIIDNVAYDPYFILGVTPEDGIEHVSKEFKKKAKMLHPDKMSIQDKQDSKKVLKRSKQFKILSECFSFISNKKQSYNNNGNNNKDHIEIRNVGDIPQKEFDNSGELNKFNDEFNRLKVQTPNDFGYTAQRMPELSTTTFERLKSEYNSDTFKPAQIFPGNNKKFDPQNFNKVFEYHQSQFSDNSSETALIHQTTDGFNAYNSGFLSGSGDLGCASVSSFNGVMIVGDNFGESGIGYNDGNYSDYQQSFKAQKNPESNVVVPSDFKQKITKDTALSQQEMDKQIRLRKSNVSNVPSGSNLVMSGSGSNKANFHLQEQQLLETQRLNNERKAQKDQEFILKYQHMYDQQTIQDAINKRLVTNQDYTDYSTSQTQQQVQQPQQFQQSIQQQDSLHRIPNQLPSHPQNTRIPENIERVIDPRTIDPRTIDPRRLDPRYQSYFY